MNALNLIVAKHLAEREGLSDRRALQLGLVASMLPTTTGILLSTVMARREAESASRQPDDDVDVIGGNTDTQQVASSARTHNNRVGAE